MRTWNEIIGHKNVLSHLKKAVSAGRPAHAYAFHGDDGTGKRTVADIFAKSLLCEKKAADGFTPCGKCRSCLQCESGNQPDIIRITHEKAAISVDDIRTQIIAQMDIRPYSSPYKIFIVDEAEKMNEQAQNALLKTLEEPPEYGIIILLTNNMNTFLETIRSRVVELDFFPVQTEEISGFLIKEKQIPDYQAKTAAGASGGSPGLAWAWVDSEEFAERREQSVKLLKKLGELSKAQVFSKAREWAKEKDEIEFFLRMLENWIKEVLLVKSGVTDRPGMFSQEKEAVRKQAESLDYGYFGELSESIHELRARMRVNVNTEICFEELLLKL